MTLTELLATADYAGLSDSEAAALANQKRHPGPAFWTYRGLASSQGIGTAATRRLIQTMDAVATADPLVGEMRYSLRGETGIDANDAETQGMLDSFAADSDLQLTADDANAIQSLADNQKSDVELYGLGTVQEKHVRWSRQ